jgi:hypothetical protein
MKSSIFRQEKRFLHQENVKNGDSKDDIVLPSDSLVEPPENLTEADYSAKVWINLPLTFSPWS